MIGIGQARREPGEKMQSKTIDRGKRSGWELRLDGNDNIVAG